MCSLIEDQTTFPYQEEKMHLIQIICDEVRLALEKIFWYDYSIVRIDIIIMGY